MKRALLITLVFATAAAGFSALNQAAKRGAQRLQIERANWAQQKQLLAQLQNDVKAETAKVRDLTDESTQTAPATLSDPALIDLLLARNINWMPLNAQRRLLAELGVDENSTRDYAIVSKSVLPDYRIRPVSKDSRAWHLTPEVRDVLAITPDEQKSVEGAFATRLQKLEIWAQENMQRESGKNETLVSYTIPSNSEIENTLITELFSTVADTIGPQRTELLKNYCLNDKALDEGQTGPNPKKLSIWRVPGATGLYYTEDAMSPGGAELGIRNATPIETKLFPAAFRYVFPGGWEEIAQREGLQLKGTSN